MSEENTQETQTENQQEENLETDQPENAEALNNQDLTPQEESAQDDQQDSSGDNTEEANSDQGSEDQEEAQDDQEKNEKPQTNAPEGLKAILESAIFVADGPLNVDQLLSLFHEDEGEILDKQTIRDTLEEIAEDYADRGIELKQIASGYRFQARQSYSKWVNRLWTERPPRYTRALLETLALIAYRQPITRGEIESVRGVSVSSHVIKTLLEREWVKVAGHRDVPGRPAVYATTKHFLDYFNLKNLSELPTLQELRDLDDIAQDLFVNGDPTDKASEEEQKDTQEEGQQQDQNETQNDDQKEDNNETESDQASGEQLTAEALENPQQEDEVSDESTDQDKDA